MARRDQRVLDACLFEDFLSQLVAGVEFRVGQVGANHSHRVALAVFEVHTPGKQRIVNAEALEGHPAQMKPLYSDRWSDSSLGGTGFDTRHGAGGRLAKTQADGQSGKPSYRSPSGRSLQEMAARDLPF